MSPLTSGFEPEPPEGDATALPLAPAQSKSLLRLNCHRESVLPDAATRLGSITGSPCDIRATLTTATNGRLSMNTRWKTKTLRKWSNIQFYFNKNHACFRWNNLKALVSVVIENQDLDTRKCLSTLSSYPGTWIRSSQPSDPNLLGRSPNFQRQYSMSLTTEQNVSSKYFFKPPMSTLSTG